MNAENNKKVRPGVALLVVLFIVMAITILSLGFVTRSDVELVCGRNMLLRTQMDYLAESGLEHARGLILNPQDVSAEYWTGGTGLQLVSGNNDYYDVTVNQDPGDRCNYIIACDAYRLEGTEKIGLSRLHAVLRIDPCIAYWVGSDSIIPSQMVITGDVYCGGTLTNNSSNIDGDAFATGMISGTITGRKNEFVTSGDPVAWPSLVSTNFSSTYYIGSNLYDVDVPADSNALVGSFPASGMNRAKIWYCASDANMPGGATISGTLVVNGNLTVSGANNFIIAEPNFPALLVGGQVVIKDNSSLVINGLAQIQGPITFDPSAINANLQVTGGLFINGGGIEGITSGSVVVSIIADPAIASIETWSETAVPSRWSPAAGAFFKSITRPPAE
jgi:hypothetical protein